VEKVEDGLEQAVRVLATWFPIDGIGTKVVDRRAVTAPIPIR